MASGKNTFVVEITGQSNETWQGSVSWVNQQRTVPFRSALELLRLIDSTMTDSAGEDRETA